MKLRPKYIPLLATFLVLVALYTVGSVSYRNFFSLRVAVDLVGDNGFLGIAAVGATFVILSGGIDLSVGAVVAATSILIARLLIGPLDLPLIGPLNVPAEAAIAPGAACGSRFRRRDGSDYSLLPATVVPDNVGGHVFGSGAGLRHPPSVAGH